MGRPRTHGVNGQTKVQHPSLILYLMPLLTGQGMLEGCGRAGRGFPVLLDLVRFMVDAHRARVSELGVREDGEFLFWRPPSSSALGL